MFGYCPCLGQSVSAPHELKNEIPQGSPLSDTRFSIAMNRIFESIETSVGKCLYVNDLALFYSENKVKIDTLIENFNSIGFLLGN